MYPYSVSYGNHHTLRPMVWIFGCKTHWALLDDPVNFTASLHISNYCSVVLVYAVNLWCCNLCYQKQVERTSVESTGVHIGMKAASLATCTQEIQGRRTQGGEKGKVVINVKKKTEFSENKRKLECKRWRVLCLLELVCSSSACFQCQYVACPRKKHAILQGYDWKSLEKPSSGGCNQFFAS